MLIGLSPIEQVLWALWLMRDFSLATDCTTVVMSLPESTRKSRDTPLTLARMKRC